MTLCDTISMIITLMIRNCSWIFRSLNWVTQLNLTIIPSICVIFRSLESLRWPSDCYWENGVCNLIFVSYVYFWYIIVCLSSLKELFISLIKMNHLLSTVITFPPNSNYLYSHHSFPHFSTTTKNNY